MDLTDFTENYLNQLMAKMAGNKNNIFLLGDFNIDLMKNDIDMSTSTFLDLLTCLSHIIHPTRITPNSKTLIDNIFSNSPTFSEGISGNITLSDHLAQFLMSLQKSTCTNVIQKTLTGKIFYLIALILIGP